MTSVIDTTVSEVMNEMLHTIVSQSNEPDRFAGFTEMGLIVPKDAVEQMKDIQNLIIQALRVFQPQLVDFVENPPKRIFRSRKQNAREAEQFIEKKLNRLLVQFRDTDDVQSIKKIMHSTDERKCTKCKRSKPLKYFLKARLKLPIKPEKLVKVCQICRSGKKRSQTENPSKKTLWRTFWMTTVKDILYRPCIFCQSTHPHHLECDHMPNNTKTVSLSKHSHWSGIKDANESCTCFLTELLNMRAFLCHNCHSKISKTQNTGGKRKPSSSDPKINKRRTRINKNNKKYHKAAANFRINLKTGTLEPHLLARLQEVITGKIGECRYCGLKCTRDNVGNFDFNHIFPELKSYTKKGRKIEYAHILGSLCSDEKRMQKLEYEAKKAGCEQVCHECHQKVTAEQNALN